MLNGIPKNVSPDLLKVLMEMGHGDEIVLSDGNYPATSSGNLLVRCIGLGVPEILESILTLMPLDDYVESLSLIHISEPTRRNNLSRMPSSA